MAKFYKISQEPYAVILGTSKPSGLVVGDIVTSTGALAVTGDGRYISATADFGALSYPEIPEMESPSKLRQEPGVIAYPIFDDSELILSAGDVTKIGASNLTEVRDFDVTLGLKIYRYRKAV